VCGINRIAPVFLGASISTPFVANVKLPMIYVVDDVQIIMIKRVYGLSGCHREGLVFLYVQSSCWLWVVRKGVRLRLGKHWVTSRSSHLLFLWLGSVLYMWFCVVCFLKGWVIVDAVGWVYGTHLLFKGLVQLSCGMEEVVVCVNDIMLLSLRDIRNLLPSSMSILLTILLNVSIPSARRTFEYYDYQF